MKSETHNKQKKNAKKYKETEMFLFTEENNIRKKKKKK